MVSLEPTTSKGGFTFENISSDLMESTDVINSASDAKDTMPLTVIAEPDFKKIKTTPAILLNILLIILFVVGVFIIPYVCDAKNVDFNSFDLLIYIHAGIWFMKLSFDRFYHSQHMQSKRYGYLEFYRQSRLIRSLPLIVISVGNSILLVIVKVLTTHCPVRCTQANLTPSNFLQIFVSAEALILLTILSLYLRVTIQFNTECKSPDINKEFDRPSFMPFQLTDIGYKDSSYVRNVLENQADMIRYLQERNKNLVMKLYNLRDTPYMNTKQDTSNITIN